MAEDGSLFQDDSLSIHSVIGRVKALYDQIPPDTKNLARTKFNEAVWSFVIFHFNASLVQLMQVKQVFALSEKARQ